MRNFTLSFLFCLFILCSCASNSSNKKKSVDSPLVGKWKIESYADPFKATLDATIVGEDEIYTLQFNDTGDFSFSTDCNTLSGEYVLNGQNLRVEHFAATELACDKEVAERSIKSNLPMVVSYDFLNDSTLCLLGSRGNVLVRLIRINGHE